MESIVDDELLIELARPIVAATAPAENELYPLLVDAYLRRPNHVPRSKASGDTLGFGLPELAVIVTPIILAAVNEAVQEVVRDAVLRGTEVTKQAVRRLFGVAKPASGETALMLTDEQWSKVHGIVLRVATQGGIAAEQAHLIADAVVGQGHLRP